jgi:hypothetical protein
VYDQRGNCLGEIAGEQKELAGAVSLAISPEGNLYVSTNGTKSIKAFVVKGAGN